MHYKAWGFTPDDNFCRIDVAPVAAELDVQAFDGDESDYKKPRRRLDTQDAGETEAGVLVARGTFPEAMPEPNGPDISDSERGFLPYKLSLVPRLMAM